MTSPRDCPLCGNLVKVRWDHEHYVYCCDDWAPDGPAQMRGSSLRSSEEAVREWNEKVSDWLATNDQGDLR